MIQTLGHCHRLRVHLLTAGYISHGFKPNTKKIGNKGKTWIPAVFDALGRQCVQAIQRCQIQTFGNTSDQLTKMWYFQRERWTFHAKGIWFTKYEAGRSTNNTVQDTAMKMMEINDATSLCAAIHGSGNHGERSAGRDMESNVIVIFVDSAQTRPNQFQAMFQSEWNSMRRYAYSIESEKVQPLSFLLRIMLPLIRPFF
jgi:hypothetical protein